ncbi:MAG: hypothetical protein JNK82_13595, partial [Myxococcaceae bacterium]|nr:hypothetical protein [Myxococcaceae bacterium]
MVRPVALTVLLSFAAACTCITIPDGTRFPEGAGGGEASAGGAAGDGGTAGGASGCTPACTGSQVCIAGACRNADCANGTLCAKGQTCVADTCVTTECEGVSCAASEVCERGQCRSRSCADAGLCPAGHACPAGACVDVACEGVICPPMTACALGRCSPGCASGQACSVNPGAPCKRGSTSCSGLNAICTDGANAADGVACDGGICFNGACTACMPGVGCTSNPDPCRVGTVTCPAGGAQCQDTAQARAPGSSCGSDRVCGADGGCLDCAAGTACTTNPTVCRTGVVQCSSGAPRCVDDRLATPGSRCGVNQVCEASGACVACVTGSACSTNPDPCKLGVLDCSGGTPVCNDGMAKVTGAPCGAGRVCTAGGQCVDCAAGAACGTNPNVCRRGAIACQTGAPVCVDGAPAQAGGSCGAMQVCDGDGGCIACTPGQPCTTNPNACKVGITACGTGTSSCIDSATNVPAGNTCGANLVCNGSGSCGACTQGATCSTNPNRCKQGVV